MFAKRLTGHSKEINPSLHTSKKLTACFLPQFLHLNQETTDIFFIERGFMNYFIEKKDF